MTMNTNLEIFLNAAALTRATGAAPQTIRKKIQMGLIVPDAILSESLGRAPSPLFASSKLAAITAAITEKTTNNR